MKLSINKVLASLAIILGLVLAVVPSGEQVIRINDLLLSIQQSPALIDTEVLADWIIQGRNDFVIIDVREKDASEKHSIQSALNITLEDIKNKHFAKKVLPEEKLLFILGNAEAKAAQFALLLSNYGWQTYVIKGGYESWVNNVLEPEKPEQFFSEHQINGWNKRQKISEYFKGELNLETETTVIKPVIPKLNSHARQGSRDEGC